MLPPYRILDTGAAFDCIQLRQAALVMQGEIQILGQTRHGLLADDPTLAGQLKLGMVFQNGALFDSLSVGENVGFQLYEHTKMPGPRIAVGTSFARVRPLCKHSDVCTHEVTGSTT